MQQAPSMPDHSFCNSRLIFSTARIKAPWLQNGAPPPRRAAATTFFFSQSFAKTSNTRSNTCRPAFASPSARYRHGLSWKKARTRRAHVNAPQHRNTPCSMLISQPSAAVVGKQWPMMRAAYWLVML